MTKKDIDDAVLKAIGQIAVKMDFDNPAHLKFILGTVSTSATFMDSEIGRKFAKKISAKLTGQLERDGELMDIEPLEALIRRSDEKTKSLFREIDDSLFHLASQQTARNTQKLVWTILALTLINTITLIFVALFIWKVNMG